MIMKKTTFSKQSQQGSVLLEALIAVVIFSIGILGLVAMLARSTNSVNDTRLRDDVFTAFNSEIAQKQVISRNVKNFNDTQLNISINQNDTFLKRLSNEKAFNLQSGESLQHRMQEYDSQKFSIDGPEGNARGYLSRNQLEYGVEREKEQSGARSLEFFSYRDDGPIRHKN